MRYEHVKRWFTSEEKFIKTPVGIFLLGAFLGELSPDPTDAIHFWLQEHIFNNAASYSKTFITSLQIFDWYFMSACWFLLLLILAYFLHVKKVKTIRRVSLIGAILSIGAAIGILAKFFFSG